MTETEAIEQLKGGNIAGLELLVKMYQVRATQAAYLVVGDWQTAEDVVQSVFLYMYEHIRQFDSNRPFAPWFLRSVVNRACTVARDHKRSVSIDSEHSDPPTFAERLIAPDLIDSLETRQAVWAALCELPPEQRAVVVLRYYLDMDTDDIAEELACPAATVKWRLYMARRRLRLLLMPLWRAMFQ